MGSEEKMTDLLWNPPTKLPPNTGLYGETDVLHLNLPSSPCMFGIDKRVGQNLGGVAVGELEKLVKNGGVCILDSRSGRKEDCNRSSRGWELVRSHVRASLSERPRTERQIVYLRNIYYILTATFSEFLFKFLLH